MGPVLVHARRARDDVLVHERRTECRRGHGSEGGLDGSHMPLLIQSG
jgi:hypothetical protein